MRSKIGTVVVGIIAAVVIGGILVAVASPPQGSRSFSPVYPSTILTPMANGPSLGVAQGGVGFQYAPGAGGLSSLAAAASTVAGAAGMAHGGTTIISSSTAVQTITRAATSTVTSTAPGGIGVANVVAGGNGNPNRLQTATPAASPAKGAAFVEFFTNVTLKVTSAPAAFDRASAVAASLGGYVAYSTQTNSSALIVLRVPSGNYQDALGQVESLGTLVQATSSSNDVTVQYTDLNATLLSLQTEQASLIKILGQTTNINATLNIESRIQAVDQSINAAESQILQTRTLVSYGTITVNMQQNAAPLPLSLRLTGTPKSGLSPLSVTFSAVVKGGLAPLVVNYNFGDGTSAQGQGLIHVFASSGRYNVTVTATDAAANVTQAWTMVDVAPSPASSSLGGFPNFVGALFLQVAEGIVEVAVVVIPIALTLLLIVFPLRHKLGISAKERKAGPPDSTS